MSNAPNRGPRRDPRADRDSAAKVELRRAAAALTKEAGLPTNLAHQVALGNITLNDVVERLAKRDRVDALTRKHELPKSLATQIALGQADLDQVLIKRRLAAHLEANRDRSSLAAAAANNTLVVLGVHDAGLLRGHIREVGQYEVHLNLDSGESATVHKLRVKYMTDDVHAKGARNQIRRDKERPERCEPIWKPQDRYGCSDRRLFGFIDEQAEVQVTLLEGEVLRGLPSWMGRWDFGMVLPKKKAEIIIFRHALADVRRA